MTLIANGESALSVRTKLNGLLQDRFRIPFLTRASLAEWILAGNVPQSGGIYIAEGLFYRGVPNSSAIPDLPGLVPHRFVSPDHFGGKGWAAIEAAWAYACTLAATGQSQVVPSNTMTTFAFIGGRYHADATQTRVLESSGSGMQIEFRDGARAFHLSFLLRHRMIEVHRPYLIGGTYDMDYGIMWEPPEGQGLRQGFIYGGTFYRIQNAAKTARAIACWGNATHIVVDVATCDECDVGLWGSKKGTGEANSGYVVSGFQAFRSRRHAIHVKTGGEWKLNGVRVRQSEQPNIYVEPEDTPPRALELYFTDVTSTGGHTDLTTRERYTITSISDNGSGKARLNLSSGTHKLWVGLKNLLIAGTGIPAYDTADLSCLGMAADGTWIDTDVDFAGTATGELIHCGWDNFFDGGAGNLGYINDLFITGGNTNSSFFRGVYNGQLSNHRLKVNAWAENCNRIMRIGGGFRGRNDSAREDVPICGQASGIHELGDSVPEGAGVSTLSRFALRSPRTSAGLVGGKPAAYNAFSTGGDNARVDGPFVIADGAAVTGALTVNGTPVSLHGHTHSFADMVDRLQASRHGLSPATNLYLDYDMEDSSFYSSAQVVQFFTNSVANLGRREVGLVANGELVTGWVPMSKAASYAISGVARTSSGSVDVTSTVEVEFGQQAADGTITPTRRVLLQARTNDATTTPATLIDATTASEDRARFVMTRSGTGSGAARMGGLRINRQATTDTIIDRAVTSIKAGLMRASNWGFSSAANLYPDYDMEDAAFYTSANALTFGTGLSVNQGRRDLRMAANGEAFSGWVPIEKGLPIRVTGGARTSAAGSSGATSTVEIEFGIQQTNGTITPTRRTLVQTKTNSNSTHPATIDEATTTSEDRYRFVLTRSGGGTEAAIMAGLRVHTAASVGIFTGALEHNTAGSVAMELRAGGNNANGRLLNISKTRAANPSDFTTPVQSGDSLFRINGRGADGAGPIDAVSIRAEAEGTIATGNVPGRLSLWTRDAAGTLAERVRVTPEGLVGIGTTSPSTTLHVSGPARVGSYTVGTVPSASASGAGAIIYVSNETGGACLAFSDGTNWRRPSDRTVIS
jgi:hypothetical protein